MPEQSLPPGFELDAPQGAAALPPGFEIDQPQRARLARQMTHAPQGPRPPQFVEEMGAGGQALAGVGKAFADIGRGASQLVGATSREDVAEARRIDEPLMQTGPGRAGAIGGTIAAFAPLAMVPGANTAAGATLLGGAMGATQPVGPGESRIVNAAIGAGGGAAGAGLASGISRLFTGKIPIGNVVDDAGRFTDEAIDRLSALSQRSPEAADDVARSVAAAMDEGAVLSPEQALRMDLFQRRGVTPTRFNVTQKIEDSVEQQSAIKRPGAVAETVAEQDAQLISAARDGIESIGPVAQDLPTTNTGVFSAVDEVVTRVDQEVGAAYAAAREAAQGQPLVGIDKMARVLSDNRGTEKVSGGVISALKGTLKNKGLIRKGSDIDINKRGPRFTGDDARRMSVNEAEEIRQSLNALHDSVSPQGRRLIRQLKDALDDDVEAAIGGDIFADARAAKVGLQRMIERGRRNKFDKTRGGFLEDVIDNKIPEEKIVDKLLTGRVDDFDKFKSFLTEDAGAAGVQAWTDIKAQVLRSAMDKALSTVGKGEGGQGVFNARLFRNALDPLRKSGRFARLFNEDEAALIDDIIEIGKLRTPIASVQQGKGPTELAVAEARRAILSQIPLIGERATVVAEALISVRGAKAALDPARATISELRRKAASPPVRAAAGITRLSGPAAAIGLDQSPPPQ